MKFKIFIILFITVSCSPHYTKLDNRKPYNSKGFAYIYNNKDYEDKIIKKKIEQ